MQRREFTLGAALALMGSGTWAAKHSNGGRLMQMQPFAPTSPGETHSALALSNLAFAGNYRFAGRTRTVKQLRTGSAPNAWEVGWLFWNFVDANHLYYFVLKPNGWEIGKRDPRYAVPGVNDGQKIMATGDSAKLALGSWYDFDIRVAGNEADIYINGQFVCHFKDSDTSPLTAGCVGLYTEDALSQWDSIAAPVVDSFDMEPLQAFADGSQLTNWRIAWLGYGSGGIVNAPVP